MLKSNFSTNNKNSNKNKILFLMTGSISCYKACFLISKLVQNNFEVKVVASSSALKFIGKATLEGLTGHPVLSDLWQEGSLMNHIYLNRWSDLIIMAPATAHSINKMAQGFGEDLLSSIFLTHEFKKPFLVAPAMNSSMYLHPITQSSIEKLSNLGLHILETDYGTLACKEVGPGKLLDPDLIYFQILKSLNLHKDQFLKQSLKNKKTIPDNPVFKKIIVTSGGTFEALDDVRVLTNTSTGSTGAFLADQLTSRGYLVTYVHGSTAQQPKNKSFKDLKFDNYESLKDLLQKELSSESYFAIIHAAAVSDFTLDKINGKISSDNNLTLQLKPTIKIVNQLKNWSKNPKIKLISFKLTSTKKMELRKKAVEKLMKLSNSDLVIQNDMTEITKLNHPFSLYKNTKKKPVSAKNKFELSENLIQILSKW